MKPPDIKNVETHSWGEARESFYGLTASSIEWKCKKCGVLLETRTIGESSYSFYVLFKIKSVNNWFKLENTYPSCEEYIMQQALE